MYRRKAPGEDMTTLNQQYNPLTMAENPHVAVSGKSLNSVNLWIQGFPMTTRPWWRFSVQPLIVDRTGSDGKLRTSKACEGIHGLSTLLSIHDTDRAVECRRRKQKCNGLTPCDVCSRRGSQCRYRGFLRNRATRALIAQRRSQNSPPQQELSDSHNADAHAAERESTDVDDGNRPVPHQERIFNNVRATYAAPESPSCLLQLYYGPSSNFSFLQHIHSHLTARRASQSISDDNNDGDQGIDRFKYKGIVFGSASKKRPAISPVFLHYDLAKSFLLNFL